MADDRRDNPRFEHAIDITYVLDDGTTFKVCRMKNISASGAFIELNQPVSPKDMIKLSLPHSDEIINAEIVWCQVKPGHVDNHVNTYSCGLKYKDVIIQKVNEILEEIESRK